MIAQIISDALVGLVEGVLRVLANTGVSEADLEAAKADAMAKISSLSSAELAQQAREWRIVQGLEN